MELKQRFVSLAESGHLTKSELCEQFSISHKTDHKWIVGYRDFGMAGLTDRSHAPVHVPARTGVEIERLIVAERLIDRNSHPFSTAYPRFRIFGTNFRKTNKTPLFRLEVSVKHCCDSNHGTKKVYYFPLNSSDASDPFDNEGKQDGFSVKLGSYINFSLFN